MNQDSGGDFSSGCNTTGLDPNVAGVLCYFLFWVSGLIFLLLETENKFIRFHALQSIFLFGGLTLLIFFFGFMSIVLGWFTIVAWLIGFVLIPLVQIGIFVLWIVLMIKAYQGQTWKLPVAGDLATKYA